MTDEKGDALRQVESRIAALIAQRDALSPLCNWASHDRRFISQQLRSARLQAAKLRGTHTADEWAALVARFGGRCVRCGRCPHAVEKDHIVPLYQGGSHAIDNLQPICPWCNCAKGAETTNWVAYRDQHGFEAAR